MNPTLGLVMMVVAAGSLGVLALQGQFGRRSSDPEGREELRAMEARILANYRRRAGGGGVD